MSTGAVLRTRSHVNAIDSSGQVFRGFYIWTNIAPAVKQDPDLCFAKCLVLSGSTPDVFKCRQVEPFDPERKEFDVPSKFAYNVNSNIDPTQFPDIGMIPHTNDAAALDFVKQRYLKSQIYTEARPLLIAINPFKDIGNATEEVILKYRDTQDIEKLPPHVFTVARLALGNLHEIQKSQTIIVSGESGAGKTEAVKQVMRYLAAARYGKKNTHIQNAVLAANPVLEAFGNAKTIRNNNSSRFGRFIKLQVQPEGGIEYGCVSSFLLEKSRILTQDIDERSYHIFYQLLKGASSEQQKKYKLLGLNKYKFLNPKSSTAAGINDIEDWNLVQESLNHMGMTPEEKDSIFSIVSGVLLLGNVEISTHQCQGIPDAACLDEKNKELLKDACSLLFLDPVAVEKGLSVKISKAGGEDVKGYWNNQEATMLKDSLSKGMYDRLFDWIIQRLNKTIKPREESNRFLALLDIFGFEVFKKNSLEQLLINITNEMLQKNFIDAVFDRETKLYREEAISAVDLVWTTNDEVIEALISRRNSIMTALEDQCLAPGGTDEKFLIAAHNNLKNSCKLINAKVGANVNFIIDHTIGQILYCSTNFLFKNKDVLRPELIEVVQKSTNPVASGSFKNVVIEKGRLAKGQLIGSQFLGQLSSLMEIINTTEPHFIRCVKPNECKSPLKFVPSRVMVQLHSLSILEALQLRNLGYAYRRPFEDFLYQYKFVNMEIATDKSKTSKQKAELLLTSTGISSDLWQIGKTMVFMKPAATKQMTLKQRESLSKWTPVVELIESLILKARYKKEYLKLCPVLTRIQARCRQKLVNKVHAPYHTVNVKEW